MSRDPEPNLRGSYRLLATAARLVQRRQDEALAPLGLTRAAVIALEAVAPRPLNQEQLAAKVHVQSQTLGRVLARLESQGLVTRTRHAADRRQLQVELTEAGKAILNAARQAEIDAFPAAMDVQGWETLQEQLARFVDSFEAPPPDLQNRPGQDGPPAARAPDGTHQRPFSADGDSARLETTDGY